MKEDRRDRRTVEDLLREDADRAQHLRAQNLAGINETADEEPDQRKQDWDTPDPNEALPVRRQDDEEDRKQDDDEPEKKRRQDDDEEDRKQDDDDEEPKGKRRQDDDDEEPKGKRRQDDEEDRKQDDDEPKGKRRQDDEEPKGKRRQDDDDEPKGKRRQDDDDDEPKGKRRQDDDEEDRKQDDDDDEPEKKRRQDDPDKLDDRARRLRNQAKKKKEEAEDKRRKADSLDMECRALRRQAESDDDDVPVRRKQDAKDEMIEKAAKLRRLRREAEDDEAEAAEARKQADKCEKDARRIRRQETETSQDDYAGSFGGKRRQDDEDELPDKLREDMEAAAEKMAAHAVEKGSDQDKETLKKKFLAGMEKMQAKNKDKGRKQDDDDDDDDRRRKQDDDDPPSRKRRGDDEDFPGADGRKQGDKAPDAVLDSVSANEGRRFMGPDAASLRENFVLEGTAWKPPTVMSSLRTKLGDDYQRLIDEVSVLPWVQVLERKDYRDTREAYVRIVSRPRVDESGNKIYNQVYLFEDPTTKTISARWLTGRGTYRNGKEFKTVDDVVAWLGMPSRVSESRRFDLDRRAGGFLAEDFSGDTDKWFDDLVEVSGDVSGPVKAAILKLVQGPCTEKALGAMEAEIKKLPAKPQKAMLAQVKAIREGTYKREFGNQFGGRAGNVQGNSQVSNFFDLIRQAITYNDGSNPAYEDKTEFRKQAQRLRREAEEFEDSGRRVRRQAEDAEAEARSLRRKADDKDDEAQKKRRKGVTEGKDDDEAEAKRLRRQADEEEEEARRLRRKEDEAEAESKRLRRQADEKEAEADGRKVDGETVRLRRQADDKEVEVRRTLREAEEEKIDANRLRRKADNLDAKPDRKQGSDEELKLERLRKQAEEKDAKCDQLRKQAEEAEAEARRLRRQADDTEEEAKRKGFDRQDSGKKEDRPFDQAAPGRKADDEKDAKKGLHEGRLVIFTEGKLSAAFDSGFQAAFVSDGDRGVSLRAIGPEAGLAGAYRKVSQLFDENKATFKTVMEALHGQELKLDTISLDENLWTSHAAYSLCSHRDADEVIEEALFGELKVEKTLVERPPISEEAAPKDIKVTNPGVLEIPEGKKFEDMPDSHFTKLIKSKGQKAIMLALLNLERWNKGKNAPVASRARALIDKFKEEEK